MNAHQQLVNLMLTPLPTVSVQRRKPYRPTRRQVNRVYNLLNTAIFDNQLSRCPINIAQEYKYLAYCRGYPFKTSRGTYCYIKIPNKYFSVQWLIMILAHEMSHQYQWDVIGKQRLIRGQNPIMSHGASFFLYKQKLAEFGIPLRRRVNIEKWFRHQDLRKL